LISALTREIALIEGKEYSLFFFVEDQNQEIIIIIIVPSFFFCNQIGPPGTGKTVVGVQIMKVLLARENRRMNIGPILTICFTNHALDQFLEVQYINLIS
jgi:hypothetical protein